MGDQSTSRPSIEAAAGATVQVPFRLPADLLDRVDERKSAVGLSRNAWLVKVIEWALEQPIHERTVTRKEQV